MSFYRSSEGGYPPAWGPPTSTLKYTATHVLYSSIADFLNLIAFVKRTTNSHPTSQNSPTHSQISSTASSPSLKPAPPNQPKVGLGIRGLINSRKLGETGLGPKLPYLALINLGIASSLFHSSLKYSTQMCDEFSMLIATFIVFYRLLSFSQTLVPPRVLLGGLCALMVTVMVAQLVTGESTVQQIVFTGMVYWLWHMCFKLISNIEGEEVVKRKMRWMAVSGIAFFVTGHACWATDFYACDGLRETRRRLGMPWAAVLELHGFWHIFTGIGVYIFMVLVECLRSVSHKDEMTSAGLRLSSSGTWPFMVFVEDTGTRTNKKKS